MLLGTGCYWIHLHCNSTPMPNDILYVSPAHSPNTPVIQSGDPNLPSSTHTTNPKTPSSPSSGFYSIRQSRDQPIRACPLPRNELKLESGSPSKPASTSTYLITISIPPLYPKPTTQQLTNMFRQSIVKATRPATRAFATTARAMGAGDTGAVRPTGQTCVASSTSPAPSDVVTSSSS